MLVTKIKIKKFAPNNGHIGFVSCIIDNWLYINNIAIFSRLNSDKIRLVFPVKKVGDKAIPLFYPLNPQAYYDLENIIFEHYKNL